MNHDSLLGNVSILAVGDLYQLPPVLQRPLFETISDPYAALYQGACLWKDAFQLFELTTIMRQDDTTFTAMLNRVRIGKQTNEDMKLLHSRTITECDVNYPHEALHVYSTNNCVNENYQC